MAIQSSDKDELQIDVLLNLGCSNSQARVYLVLIRIGTSPISSISKFTGIYRENLYKIVESLIKKGLIVKELGIPCKYRAVSPAEALPVLLKQKQIQIAQLKSKTLTIIEALNDRENKIETTNENSEFLTISGRNQIIKRLQIGLQNTKFSLEAVTSKKRFSTAITELSESLKQALKRGVKIRLVTEKYFPEQETLAIITNLSRNPNFQVRFFSEEIPAIVALFDEKHVHISLSSTAPLPGAEALWSNNDSIIVITKAYFEQKWAASALLDFKEKVIALN